MWTALMLMACSEPEARLTPVELESPTGQVGVEMEPAAFEFGAVALGDTLTAPLRIYNTGDINVLIGDFGATAAALEVTNLGALMLVPGGNAELIVTWHPEETGLFNERLFFELGTNPTELLDFTVPVTGSAEGVELFVSTDSLAFGDVDVGCEETQSVTLTNRGSVDVTIEDYGLVQETGFSLAGRDGGALPPLPWVMQTGDSQTLELTFAPAATRNVATVLELSTSDPLEPEIDVTVTARGVTAGSQSLTFYVEPTEWQYVTAVIQVNETAITGTYSARLQAALPVFFEQLLTSPTPFRLAAFLDANGEVYGGVDYIDESFTPTEATATFMAMLGNRSIYGDHDQCLLTLENAIAANRDWLLDEADVWENAKLNVIAINDDIEQSPGYYSQYVSAYQAYKSEPQWVVVHAIGGDVPRGCQGADPFTAFHDAAALTGGEFFSICEADWTSNMRVLADAMMGESQGFGLVGDPLIDSIEVFIDGEELRGGWSYSASINQVQFEAGSFPAFGSTVRVDYITASECG